MMTIGTDMETLDSHFHGNDRSVLFWVSRKEITLLQTWFAGLAGRPWRRGKRRGM